MFTGAYISSERFYPDFRAALFIKEYSFIIKKSSFEPKPKT